MNELWDTLKVFLSSQDNKDLEKEHDRTIMTSFCIDKYLDNLVKGFVLSRKLKLPMKRRFMDTNFHSQYVDRICGHYWN